MNYFHKNLIFLLKKKKIKQIDIAEKIGITKQQFNRYCNSREPQYDYLITICEYFKVTIDSMLKKDLEKEGLK